ncbi:hypothetical protein [Niallia sp. FSL M8-0099]|uniref:hypothetical protein n=1 Tax=Niallia sp. FSL M8-0099 TaxID=2954519 RepID=UPI0030F5D9F7
MPINDDLTTIYEIPDEIKGNFTKEFIEDFRKSAIEIFRQNDINLGREPYDYESYSYYDWWVYVEGSSGFYEAFQKVCKKYNLEFIVDYYDNLPWYDSDLFDDQFGNLLIEYGLVEEGEVMEK